MQRCIPNSVMNSYSKMIDRFKSLTIFEKHSVISNINEVIRVILNLSIYLFFYKKISHTQKAQNAQKQIKIKKGSIFYAHKKHLRERKLLVWCFVLFQFVLFTLFVFFLFFGLFGLFGLFMLFILFVLFVCVKSSCKKIMKWFKIALITSFILLLKYSFFFSKLNSLVSKLLLKIEKKKVFFAKNYCSELSQKSFFFFFFFEN